jgi:hypothetical protein
VISIVECENLGYAPENNGISPPGNDGYELDPPSSRKDFFPP